MFNDVREFHIKILGVEPPESPTLVSQEYVVERTRFMLEEVTEFGDAGMTGDIVGAADAIADLIYVALGTAYSMGIPIHEVWDIVHAANMKKQKGITKRGNAVDAVKPEGWQDPKVLIAKLIGEKI